MKTLVNNGTIITNGYTLTVSGTSSGNGTKGDAGSVSLDYTLGTTGWATVCQPVALDFSSVNGLTAYKASFGISTAMLTKVSQVPAGTPVILKGSTSTRYSIPTLSSVSAISDNDLSGTLSGLIATSGSSYYALGAIDDSTVGFKLVISGVGIPAGKAYYVTGSSSRDYFAFDESTSINAPFTVRSRNTCNSIINIRGLRVKSPDKGVYIRDGKKVIYGKPVR